MDGVSRDIMLRKLYETCYGIHNHYAPGQKPLDLVTARQKEEVYLYSKKAADMKRFIDLGVAQATGLSMREFFKMSVADCEYTFQLVEKANKREHMTAAQLEEELKKAIAREKDKDK